MRRIISVDFQLKDNHSADQIYQECLRNVFHDSSFKVLCASSYVNDGADYIENVLLPIDSAKSDIYLRLVTLINNARIIWKEIHSGISKNRDIVIILQSFFIFELLILIILNICFLFSNRNFSLRNIFICRFEMNSRQYFLFRIIRFISFLSSRVKNVFYSDTQNLCDYHGKVLNVLFHLLPIPHVFRCDRTSLSNNSFKIGFPGYPRDEKGSWLAKSLIKYSNQTNFFKILLQNWEYFNEIKSNGNILFLPKETRGDYQMYICKCDLILLPYKMGNYVNRSSGIFVESICADKVVLVSKDSWMAEEMRKMGLHKYILEALDLRYIVDRIFEVRNNFQKVQQEFISKNSDFKLFHNQKNFNDVLLKHLQ